MILTPASAIPPRRAPWPHFPHCPTCHRRLHSLARSLPGPTADGRCPHCAADLHLEFALDERGNP